MKKHTLLSIFILVIFSADAAIHHPNTNNTNRIQITVTVEGAGLNDSISLQYWDHLLDLSSMSNIASHTLKKPAGNAHFIFSIPGELPGIYMTISGGRKRYFSTCIAEPGDSIQVMVYPDKIIFTGRGASKYQCFIEMAAAPKKWAANRQHGIPTPVLNGKPVQYGYPVSIESVTKYQNGNTDTAISILNTYRPVISEWSYQVMAADALAKCEDEKLNSFALYFLNFSPSFPEKQRDSLRLRIKEKYEEGKRPINLPEDILLFSAMNITHKSYEAYYASRLFNEDSIEWIISRYKGAYRDKLLAAFILKSRNLPDSVVKQVLASVRTPLWKEVIANAVNHQTKGVPAYPFELTDSSGKLVKLSDMKGKAVMLEFWFTGCSGCAEIASYMPKITSAFTDNGHVVFASVSVDEDPIKWKKSLQSGKYTGPGYLNMYTGGKGIDHPFIKYYQLQSCPKTLIIDAKGNIFSNQIPSFINQSSVDQYISMLKEAAK